MGLAKEIKNLLGINDDTWHMLTFPKEYFYLKSKLGYVDASWRFKGQPIIQKHKDAQIRIGKRVKAYSKAKYNEIGMSQAVFLHALSAGALISIGDEVGMSGCTISGNRITIGNKVLIGSGVLITDSDAHPIHPDQRQDVSLTKTKPIVIEDDVFIGARAIILKGVTIGRGAVIGAGSVVTANVEAMTIVAGNPARSIRRIGHLSGQDI